MPLSRSRDYLSIGEVLEAVTPDFPDLSISKIRFLEAEGLIAPERTASGYRKFYDGDVARLRYILSLQRDQFLPLKVIRERLDAADANGGAYPEAEPATRPAPETSPSEVAPAVATGVQMSRAELAQAAELTEEQLRGLEEFGVLGSNEGEAFDEHDLIVAKAARKFFGYGVEPRHLRMYRQFAERETSFFEQIVSPVAARRDPDGQKQATRSIRELAQLSRQIKDGVLRSQLRELL